MTPTALKQPGYTNHTAQNLLCYLLDRSPHDSAFTITSSLWGYSIYSAIPDPETSPGIISFRVTDGCSLLPPSLVEEAEHPQELQHRMKIAQAQPKLQTGIQRFVQRTWEQRQITAAHS